MSTPGRGARAWWWFGVAALGLLAGLYALWSNAYWDYSDGVYAYTARAVLHGVTPYRDIVAAQPPGVFLLGAGALAIHDSVWALRAVMGLVLLAEGGLVAAAVWRLSRHTALAAAAGLATFFLPWGLREHGALVPENLGAPLLLAVALLAARPGRAATWAGVLGALAVGVKLPLVLPVLAVAVLAADRRRFLLAFAGAGLVLAAATLAAFGSAVFDDVVTAQRQTGLHDAASIARLVVQAVWNEAPWLPALALGWSLRGRCRDRPLLRTLIALGVGDVLVTASLLKNGTFLQVVIPLESVLLILGAAAAAWWLQARAAGQERPPAWLATLALAGVVLVGLQSASLLIRPADPVLFARPFSAATFGRGLSGAGVDRAVAVARRCPPGTSYSGPPYLAFAAHRRLPGNQGDQFLLGEAASLAALRRAAQADGPFCP